MCAGLKSGSSASRTSGCRGRAARTTFRDGFPKSGCLAPFTGAGCAFRGSPLLCQGARQAVQEMPVTESPHDWRRQKGLGGVPKPESRLKSAVCVPGGWVAVDRRRHELAFTYWIKVLFFASAYSAAGVARDIVILDPTGERELYRDGPYNGITVNRVLESLVAELERMGVDEFVRAHQVQDRQLGPVSQASGHLISGELFSVYFNRARNLFARRR